MIDEEIIKKIVTKDFKSLTLDDHHALASIDGEVKEYNLTRALWTYARVREMSFYWPKTTTSILLKWNKEMINYYYQLYHPELSNEKKEPTVIRFTYQINYRNVQPEQQERIKYKNVIRQPEYKNVQSEYKNVQPEKQERQTALGKFIHYRNKMTPEEWKEQKELIRESIQTLFNEKKDPNIKLESIKIYNINEKDNGYESDDVYQLHCRDNSVKKEIIKPLSKPPIPDELSMRRPSELFYTHY